MEKKFVLLSAIVLFSVALFSQDKSYLANSLSGESIEIDGKFDEAAWQNLEWEGGFKQFEPANGAAATQKTGFKILYDNDNIYVAIKNYDTEPDKIDTRMTRRDGFDGDLCGIHFDSYFDRRTAFVFVVNAAGVKNDGFFSRDGDSYDPSLDPSWFVKTKIVSDGWNAEMKIPLSQLRFGKGDDLTWGLQVFRTVYRLEEFTIWNFISKDETGWISHYGDLEGLKNIKTKKQVELAPYIVTKINTYEKQENNPYADGIDFGLDAGIDAKIGVTNDLILDIAINPDFGQVEADPSEVNLGAFETFFEEKRPFFVEGTSITNYNITPGGSPWARDNLFYSRRVGRQPHYYPSLIENEYIDYPDNSRILGAVKLTGKTKDGWSLGIVESVVNNQMAEIDLNGDKRKVTVEPMSNYFLARLQKDMNKGNTIVGGMLTATNRKIDDDNLNFLPEAAYSAGLDFMQFFKEKKYFVSTTLVGSALYGDKEAIKVQQLSSRRYFQRPDNDYVNFDTTKTSLAGHGGTFMFGKSANSGFRFLFNLSWRSPGLELNDLGYLRYSDNIFHFIWAGYEFVQPFKGVREMQINGNEWLGWDFGGTLLFKGLNFSGNVQFDNFWRFYASFTNEFEEISNVDLRGGEALRKPGGGNLSLGFATNSKRKLRLDGGINYGWGDDDTAEAWNYSGEIIYRPFNTLSIMLAPSYNAARTSLQYINTFAGDTPVYLFGDLRQKTLSITFRVDYNITPDFTIQYYASPFVSSGLYDEYKKITDPKATEFLNRFLVYENARVHHFLDQSQGYDYYGIDDTGDMNPNYYFDNPDFNFKQFRSNLVARWEYIPGSVLFLVWAQGRTDYTFDGSFDYGRDMKDLFSVTPDDIFLVKLSHRFRL